MRLSQILKDIFIPAKDSEYKLKLAEIRENEKRLRECALILEGRTARGIRDATEEAARFDGD